MLLWAEDLILQVTGDRKDAPGKESLHLGRSVFLQDWDMVKDGLICPRMVGLA